MSEQRNPQSAAYGDTVLHPVELNIAAGVTSGSRPSPWRVALPTSKLLPSLYYLLLDTNLLVTMTP